MAQQRRSLVCGPDRRAMAAPATGAGPGARRRLLASYSWLQRQSSVSLRFFWLRFPAFSQKNKPGRLFFFAFPPGVFYHHWLGVLPGDSRGTAASRGGRGAGRLMCHLVDLSPAALECSYMRLHVDRGLFWRALSWLRLGLGLKTRIAQHCNARRRRPAPLRRTTQRARACSLSILPHSPINVPLSEEL